MSYKGYAGRLLHIDLAARTAEAREVAYGMAERHIGGVGFAAALMDEMVPVKTDPFAPQAPLFFMTGPLTGTMVPWSGRHCVAALSPLTGIWGEAFAGGTWGSALKKAGVDGLIITGRAERPVFLKVTDGAATIEDAAFLQGRDTVETEAEIRRRCGDSFRVSAIGLAGENRVRFASVMSDGPAARAAGRCGMGAVMGAKNLKAIAVAGLNPVGVAHAEKLTRSIREFLPQMVKTPEHCAAKASRVFAMFLRDGRHGINNWRDGDLLGFEKAVLREIREHAVREHPYQCAGCPTGCVESNIDTGGKRLNVWESFAPLGSQCGITDMSVVQKAYDLCNRFGIDSISAGGVISFAMECFAEGLITLKDTDGIDISFGNGQAALAMLERICRREGFGAVLAEGVRGAVSLIGGGAERFAIEVKGLEAPAHDPRAHNFLALAYATDTRGANHTGAADPGIEGFDLMDMQAVRFAVEGTGRTVARGQNYATVLNSLVLCAFSHAGYAQYYSAEGFTGVTARQVVEWLNLATGMEHDFASLLLAGERSYAVKHVVNLRQGCAASADRLHERFTGHRRGSGPAAEHLPPVGIMLEDYYRARGWQADGTLTEAKSKELGIEHTGGI
jgi:aldehyde:ferredoxin oxidoreductase